MFDPSWDEGCEGCSMIVDSMGHQSHLYARDTSLVLVSQASLNKIESFKERMGWSIRGFLLSKVTLIMILRLHLRVANSVSIKV